MFTFANAFSLCGTSPGVQRREGVWGSVQLVGCDRHLKERDGEAVHAAHPAAVAARRRARNSGSTGGARVGSDAQWRQRRSIAIDQFDDANVF